MPWANEAHGSQLLSPSTLKPVLCNERGHSMRGPCTTAKSSARSPQPKKARTATRNQGGQR